MPKKRLLILLTNPFAALNVIHSGLLSALIVAYDVTIWSAMPLAVLSEDKKLAPLRHVDYPFPDEGGLVRVLRSIQKALFFTHFKIQTETIRRKSENHFARNLIAGVSLLFLKTKLARPLLCILRPFIQLLTDKSGIPKANGFDGVISTSPLDIRENSVVNSFGRPARKMCMVISWDNLTSKGVINADHDAILVWNRYMEDEIRQQYSIYKTPLPKIYITGNPRFDRYFEKQESAHASAHLLFATSARSHFPEQATIAAHLAEYVSTRPEISLTIRCHIFDDPSAYTFVQSEQIRIETTESTGIPSLCYLDTLHQDLLSCTVCIQVASTVRIDAAACNRPVVSIAYDGDITKAYHQSVRRFYDYTHQLPLNALQFDYRVYNKDQLFQTLDRLLKTRKDEIQTRGLVKSFTHFETPAAISSTLSAIAKWLD